MQRRPGRPMGRRSGGPILQKRRARRALFFGIGLVTCVLTAACTMAFAETRTVGILNSAKVLTPAVEGFKTGMAQLGYVEGKNIIYLSNGTVGRDLEALRRETARFKARRVDLVVVVGVLAVASVKEVFEGADFPVLFNNAVRPVEEGWSTASPTRAAPSPACGFRKPPARLWNGCGSSFLGPRMFSCPTIPRTPYPA